MNIKMELYEVTRKGEWITQGAAVFVSAASIDRLTLESKEWEELGRPVNIILEIAEDEAAARFPWSDA